MPESDERGAALAEMAIIVPVLLALLLVVFDLGRGFHAFISVTNGARDAARVSMQDTDVSRITTAGKNGAKPYDVTVAPTCSAGIWTVTVTYTYTPVVPFVTAFWNGTMTEVVKTQGPCS
jgi:Flp pilus assembly protein TadG